MAGSKPYPEDRTLGARGLLEKAITGGEAPLLHPRDEAEQNRAAATWANHEPPVPQKTKNQEPRTKNHEPSAKTKPNKPAAPCETSASSSWPATKQPAATCSPRSRASPTM